MNELEQEDESLTSGELSAKFDISISKVKQILRKFAVLPIGEFCDEYGKSSYLYSSKLFGQMRLIDAIGR